MKNNELKRWRTLWEANNRLESQKRQKSRLELHDNVKVFLNTLADERSKRTKDDRTKRKADFIRHKIAVSSWLKNYKMAHQENYKQFHNLTSEKLKGIKKHTFNFLIKFIETRKEQKLSDYQKRVNRINELKQQVQTIIKR